MTSILPDATQQLILSKFKPEGTARKSVEPGEYEADFFLHVRGRIKIGEPYQQRVAQSVPWQQLATYLMGQVNAATRAKLVREFVQAQAAGTVQVAEDAMKAEAVAALDEILEATEKTCQGKLTGTALVTIVTAEELEVTS